MWKKLLNVWSGEETRLDETLGLFDEMLTLGRRMFLQVSDALFLGGEYKSLRRIIRSSDKRLNKMEQEIRRRVVTHLCIQPEGDIAACLILMSVVKDAERLGDFAKNIVEVFGHTRRLNKESEYYERLLAIRNTVLTLFDESRKAFANSDHELAWRSIKTAYRVEKDCDAIVSELLKQTGLEDAVAYAILARFFKRCLAHLGNISTSVVMPVDKLDYFDEDKLTSDLKRED